MLWLVLASFFCFGTVFADRKVLNEKLIRLHVVAASDSEEDQLIKLQVRDAVVDALQSDLESVPTAAQARQYIASHISDLEQTANDALRQAGSSQCAVVTLGKEAFDKRQYETFALPAGQYESLRVTIGEGQGKNWWCVVFPSLCMTTREQFSDTAVGAGFGNSLVSTLQQEKGYEIRFFLLDCLGWLDNWIHG